MALSLAGQEIDDRPYQQAAQDREKDDALVS